MITPRRATPDRPGSRTVVKVCGITRMEDARVALEAGADWLGLVLWEESPRRVTVGEAADLLAALPDACGVAVLVAPTPDAALAIARETGARRLQLHRVDPASWPTSFPLPVAFSVPVTAAGELAGDLPPGNALVVLDTADAGRPGGTGRSFPWHAAAALAARRPVMLAGGLDARNVERALARVHPFGVDAASRLERAPGRKDPEEVRRFVAAVRAHDARVAADAGAPGGPPA